MSHQNHVYDRLSTRLPSLLPDHLREDAPVFESFLEAYFEYLESEILVLDSIQALDGIQLEDGTQKERGAILFEKNTFAGNPEADSSKILLNASSSSDIQSDPFTKDEYIYGQSSGSIAKIRVINDKTFLVDTISGNGFTVGETIVGRSGNQTAVVKTYKENSIVASNRLLDYSDIDRTLETFLKYFQKDFIPSLNLRDTQNPRLTLKNIGTLYKEKGTEKSIQFLMRILYGESSSVRYPIEETLFASESEYEEERQCNVIMSVGQVPKETDKILQYSDDDATLVVAEAIVEKVGIISEIDRQYQLTISRTHRGTFQPNKQVKLVDRDGVTIYTGTLTGIISQVKKDDSGTYFQLEDNSGSLRYESGNASSGYTESNPNTESEMGGGLLFERARVGSMYDLNDQIRFTGSKVDASEVDAVATVSELTRGPIEHIYIENAGTGYSANDIIVFEEAGTEGAGAEAIIAATGDELILENATAFDQYEFTATAGQTTFGGLGARDLNNKPIALNGLQVKVFVDGIEQSRQNYTIFLDRVVFDTSPTPAGGERVELVSEFTRVTLEQTTTGVNGSVVMIEDGNNPDNDQRIRRIAITSGGTGYQTLPRVFPGGYIYVDNYDSFTVGETVTNQTATANGVISRIDSKNKRLVIKKTESNIGHFVTSDIITGSSSGTEGTIKQSTVTAGEGASLFAWSSKIGGVGKIRITSQGYNFDEHAVLGSDSFYNMLIGNPTAVADLTKGVTFTGRKSGATGEVISFDEQRNLLKFTNVSGTFAENEFIDYASGQYFEVLRYDPYEARGEYAGEGIINDNFFGNKGYVSSDTTNIHDGLFYQSHSYVIKVGESINAYRSAVKDLVHPAGHIFFGEVALDRYIVQDDRDGRFTVDPKNTLGIQNTTFVPTILLTTYASEHLLLEDADPDDATLGYLDSGQDPNLLNVKQRKFKILTEDGYYIENEQAFEAKASTKKETLVLFHTTASELEDLAMQINLDEAGIPTTGTDPRTDGAITEPLTEYGDSSHRNRHLNINSVRTLISAVLKSKLRSRYSGISAIDPVSQKQYQNIAHDPVAEEITISNQRSPRLDGVVSVLNLYNTDKDYLIMTKEDAVSPIGARPSDQGKVFQFAEFLDERIALEDGNLFRSEEPRNYLNHEPQNRDEVGPRIVFEDHAKIYELSDPNDPDSYNPATSGYEDISGLVVELEDETVPEMPEYFVTERSAEMYEPYFYMENGDRMIFEDGNPITDERLGSGSNLHSFAPIGSTFRSLNKIAYQQTYKIAYHIHQESGNASNIVNNINTEPDFGDRILLESGGGFMLDETSESEGLRISQLDNLLGLMYIAELPLYANRRTNIAHSTYVSSSKVTNSTLAAL